MNTPYFQIRAGHPDFLDLPWDQSITEWEHERLVDLPTGIHRHEIVFVTYPSGIYAIKELPGGLARHEWESLRRLEQLRAPVVSPVGFVERPWVDRSWESAGAIITRYADYSFSYQELLSGAAFGPRRGQMLDAFAGLLVELHRAGCFWGDCSLANVLYRWDAGAVEVLMVDAETCELHENVSDGQRKHDLQIMTTNVAGGMANIAASQGVEVEDADLLLGDDIIERYESLWAELGQEILIGPDERYRIAERVDRLNDLGFEVEDVEMTPEGDGQRLRLKALVGGRNYHTSRLRELTQIQASENQARQVLSDLYHHAAGKGMTSPTGKTVAAIQWRVGVFEPMLAKIAELEENTIEPLQAFCDFLHHRYKLSSEAGRDIGDTEAFDLWVSAGRPGFDLDG
ncbi:MAG: DUF4032 domain-containing protein [Acidimicrobiales bacterium]